MRVELKALAGDHELLQRTLKMSLNSHGLTFSCCVATYRQSTPAIGGGRVRDTVHWRYVPCRLRSESHNLPTSREVSSRPGRWRCRPTPTRWATSSAAGSCTDVTSVGRTSITLGVEVWVLRQGQGERIKVTNAEFTFVAVKEDGTKRPLSGAGSAKEPASPTDPLRGRGAPRRSTA